MQPQTTNRRRTAGVCTLLLMPTLADAADAATRAVFAEPTALSTSGAGMGVLRLVLALGLVLAAVLAAAALMRRLRNFGAAGTASLEIVSQLALGARERAVLLRAGDRQLLVGVAPGNVRLLCELHGPTDFPTTPPTGGGASDPDGQGAARPDFRELLRRSLGR